MRLNRHLDKGFWALADKAVTAGYGVIFMLLVIRILPEEEYGNYVLIQTTYLILAYLAVAIALAPLVKEYHQTDDHLGLQSNAVLLMAGFMLVTVFGLRLFLHPFARLLNSKVYAELFHYVPWLMVASFAKLYANELFRATYRIRDIFWTDAVYFVFTVGMVGVLILQHRLDSAQDMLAAMTLSYAASSLMAIWLARKSLHASFQLNRPLMRRMLVFGKYVLGSGVTGQIYERADSFIISALLNPAAVALYNAAKNFLRIFDLYRQSIALMAFPAFSRLHAENRGRDIRILFEKAIGFSYFLLLPLVLVLIIFADFFFDVILGGRYPEGAAILRPFAFMGLFVSWQAIGEGLLYGVGSPRYPFLYRIIATVVSVVLNLVLIKMLGVMGAVYASLISLATLAGLVAYQVQRKTGFSFMDMVKYSLGAVGTMRELKVRVIEQMRGKF